VKNEKLTFFMDFMSCMVNIGVVFGSALISFRPSRRLILLCACGVRGGGGGA
jgi:hypothetical protein